MIMYIISFINYGFVVFYLEFSAKIYVIKTNENK